MVSNEQFEVQLAECILSCNAQVFAVIFVLQPCIHYSHIRKKGKSMNSPSCRPGFARIEAYHSIAEVDPSHVLVVLALQQQVEARPYEFFPSCTISSILQLDPHQCEKTQKLWACYQPT